MSEPRSIEQEWEERSRQRQKAFIGHIAEKLGRDLLEQKPSHPFRGAPDFWREKQLDVEEQLALFSDNWSKAAGQSVRCKNIDEAKRFLKQFCEEMKAERLLLQDQPELTALQLQEMLPQAKCTVWNASQPTQMLETAAEADIGLAVVEHAVAFSGSVVVQSTAQQGRSVSLLPTAFVAIIPLSRLKYSLGEVMAQLDSTDAEAMPAGVHFISGPSRSADIENDLTIGVHGPGVVLALIVEDM